jgi:hypothetical protein
LPLAVCGACLRVYAALDQDRGSAGRRKSAAIRRMGTGEATVRHLEQRLRCSRCGNRQVGVTVHPDTRPHEMQERDGPAPETRAGLPD